MWVKLNGINSESLVIHLCSFKHYFFFSVHNIKLFKVLCITERSYHANTVKKNLEYKELSQEICARLCYVNVHDVYNSSLPTWTVCLLLLGLFLGLWGFDWLLFGCTFILQGR